MVAEARSLPRARVRTGHDPLGGRRTGRLPEVKATGNLRNQPTGFAVAQFLLTQTLGTIWKTASEKPSNISFPVSSSLTRCSVLPRAKGKIQCFF